MAKSIAKTQRIAPRKARLVADQVRHKSVAEAAAILRLTNKKAAVLTSKVLNSAIANATNNDGLDANELFVTEIYVNEGPTIKRFRPRAKGSASAINKRTSHITVVVGDKEALAAAKTLTKKVVVKKEVVKVEEEAPVAKKPAAKKPAAKKATTAKKPAAKKATTAKKPAAKKPAAKKEEK